MTSNSKLYYVYVYRDPRPKKNNEPIYVGKGYGKRAWEHWVSGCPHNQIFSRKLQKIRDCGMTPSITIIRVAGEALALDIERALVAAYGTIKLGTGPLCNLTAGGDGYAVGSLSEEHKAKISAKLKGRVRTDEHRANLSAAFSGKKHSAETIAKLSEIAKEKAADPSFRQAISEKLKGRKLPDGLAAVRRKQLSDMNKSPERRAQISAQMTAYHAARRAAKNQGAQK